MAQDAPGGGKSLLPVCDAHVSTCSDKALESTGQVEDLLSQVRDQLGFRTIEVDPVPRDGAPAVRAVHVRPRPNSHVTAEKSRGPPVTNSVTGRDASAELTARSSLAQESSGPGASPFASNAALRRPRDGADRLLKRPARWTACAPEGFEVGGQDRPHDSHFDSVQPLSHQQPADIGLRRVELGRGLGDR